MKPTQEEFSVRRFAGNGDVLCDIGYDGCPFVNIVGSDSGFCQLYRKKLSYVETGNNDICRRCEECLIQD